MANPPTPWEGVVGWTLAEIRRHLGRFTVGTVAVSIAWVLFSALVTLPANPTFGQRVANGLVALALAVGSVILLVGFYALAVAPYQQRNALRRMVAEGGTASPDQAILDRIDTVSQSLSARLGQYARFQPEWQEVGTDPGDHQAWQRGVNRRAAHDNSVTAGFLESEGAEVGALIAALRQRDCLTEDEVKHYRWIINVGRPDCISTALGMLQNGAERLRAKGNPTP